MGDEPYCIVLPFGSLDHAEHALEEMRWSGKVVKLDYGALEEGEPEEVSDPEPVVIDPLV